MCFKYKNSDVMVILSKIEISAADCLKALNMQSIYTESLSKLYSSELSLWYIYSYHYDTDAPLIMWYKYFCYSYTNVLLFTLLLLLFIYT